MKVQKREINHSVQGEYYPCNPDILEKTYEPIE